MITVWITIVLFSAVPGAAPHRELHVFKSHDSCVQWLADNHLRISGEIPGRTMATCTEFKIEERS